jgi:hypothetical protein
MWLITHPVAVCTQPFIHAIVAYPYTAICRFNVHLLVPNKGKTSSRIQAVIRLHPVHTLLDLAVRWIDYGNVLSYPSAIWWKFIPVKTNKPR